MIFRNTVNFWYCVYLKKGQCGLSDLQLAYCGVKMNLKVPGRSRTRTFYLEGAKLKKINKIWGFYFFNIYIWGASHKVVLPLVPSIC